MADQRLMKNLYKQGFVPVGVFVIRNTRDQRIYLGGSRNLEGAMNRHRFELTTRSHRNRQMQADWSRHGAQGFAFEVLDRIRQSDRPDFDYAAELAALLQLWRDELAVSGAAMYNPAPAIATTAAAAPIAA